MGLLMNAVNSAVSRKARAASEGVKESRPDQNLSLQAYQSENHDDPATAEVESTNFQAPSIAASESKVEGERHNGETEEIDKVLKGYAQKDMAGAENQSLALQRPASASESDTSSKRATKERMGFLRFNLLRKRVEAERSASSTPDSELPTQDSREASPRKWKSWGRKGRSKDADEVVKVEEDEMNDREMTDVIRERLRRQFRNVSLD